MLKVDRPGHVDRLQGAEVVEPCSRSYWLVVRPPTDPRCTQRTPVVGERKWRRLLVAATAVLRARAAARMG
ncbi:hypothetical protein GCM10029976_016510 [Kribbella albertanoniae]